MSKIMGVVVRDAGHLACAEHRLVRGALGDALEDSALGGAIVEGADLLDLVNQPFREVDPAGAVALRRRPREP